MTASAPAVTAQIAIALFADTAEPVLAAARVLLRHKPDPGREVPSRSESPRISDAGDQSGGQRRTDAGYLIEPLTRLVGSVPGHDLAIKLQDLGFQHPQLSTESGNTRAGHLGYPLVARIGDNYIERRLAALEQRSEKNGK